MRFNNIFDAFVIQKKFKILFSQRYKFHRSIFGCNNTLVSRKLCSNFDKRKNLSIVFYGSDDFSIASLRLLKKKLDLGKQNNLNYKSKTVITNVEVVTNSKNNLVSNYCQKVELPCHFFETYSIPPNQFDLGIVSSFGRLIPSKAINACKYGMLNIHGSLLPAWRGASPIQHSILANDKITGVTIMRVRPKRFDIGEIVAQREIEILHRITAQDLKRMMAPIGAKLLWECLENLDYCLSNAREQPDEGVTYAPKIVNSDGKIDWTTMDAEQIDRRFRAFYGYLDVYTHWIDGTVLKLGDTVDPELVSRLELEQLTECGQYHVPGLIYYHKKRHLLCVASANQTWSAFRSLTLKGRKKMSALGFYNTFIRPIAKVYRQSNSGQKPIFILGSSVNSLEANSGINSITHTTGTAASRGIYRLADLQQIAATLK